MSIYFRKLLLFPYYLQMVLNFSFLYLYFLSHSSLPSPSLFDFPIPILPPKHQSIHNYAISSSWGELFPLSLTLYSTSVVL